MKIEAATGERRDGRLAWMRPRSVSAAIAIATLVMLTSCGPDETATPQVSVSGGGATVTGADLPEGVRVAVAPAGVKPAIANTQTLSETYDLTPSGALRESLSVTLPLTSEAHPDMGVAVATAESPGGPWTLINATLSADRRSVTFTTDHFSFFSAIGADLKDLLQRFKEAFLDPLTGGAVAEASRPRCTNESAARGDGYGITSSSGSTVYWCLGMSGSQRRLTVVNNRRYPLLLSVRGTTVVSQEGLATVLLNQLSPTDDVTVLPRESVTFDVSVAAGSNARLDTKYDALSQSLYSLYVGIDSLVQILTRFGFGGGPKTAVAVGMVLDSGACANAAVSGQPMRVLAECFSPGQLYHAFGWRSTLLAPLMVFGPLIEFFRSSFNAIGDQINDRDRYGIVVTRAAASPAGGGSTPPPVGGGSGGGGSGGGQTPPPTTNPKIEVARGGAAPQGSWYSVTLSGFAPGSSVTVACHDSVDSNFWTQTFTIGGDGRAGDSTLCYSADGPDHWVTGGGVESNHVTWGGQAPPPNPPAGPRIDLGRGGAAPSGSWYSVTLSGFAPGSSVMVACHDSVDSNFWTQTFSIGSDGRAGDSTLCYSADGPDHWVTGGGVESNHIRW